MSRTRSPLSFPACFRPCRRSARPTPRPRPSLESPGHRRPPIASFAAAFSGIPTTAVLMRAGYRARQRRAGLRMWHDGARYRGKRSAVGLR
ncbi:hypothetical protein ACU4GD_38735 [Cupriavidus basilensis]